MNWFEFISSLVGSLAWPVLVFLIVIILRQDDFMVEMRQLAAVAPSVVVSDLRKLSSGKPLTSYIAQAELCQSRLNSVSYLLTGQFNM